MPENGLEIKTEELQSNEIGDLIGKPPSWLLRSGISMTAIVFISILSISSYIQYPDKVIGAGFLTALSPPIELVARSSGYIENIAVKDHQKVEEGQTLFLLSNTTNITEIEKFNAWISEYEKIKNPKYYLNLSFPKNLKLGAIQSEYASLLLKYNELQQTLKNRNVFDRIDNLSDEIDKINILNASLQKEKKIYQEELKLEEIDFKRSQILEKDGVISTKELEVSLSKYLQKKRQYESYENNLIQNNIKIDQLKLEMLKTQGDRIDLVKQYQFTINELIARYRSKVDQWSDSFQVKALGVGKITIANQVTLNAKVKQGQLLGYIIPEETEGNYISCKIPMQNAGKITVGQKVLIKLDAYPYKEYGMVVSSVSEISPIPIADKEDKRTYELKIVLPAIIKTDMGKVIPYRPKMTSTVEIITVDKSVINRIFEQFMNLLKQTSI